MFLLHRPSDEMIHEFLREWGELPLSYGPPGIVRDNIPGYRIFEVVVRVGHGPADFARAREALLSWKQFELGWVETYPRHAPVVAGTVVAVLIRHLGFWSLNGCRVLYWVGSPEDPTRFGFAYGTLPNHAESGEELFEVFIDQRTADVMYRIRATSRPQAILALLGHPIARALQARFRTDSVAAVRRATRI